MHAKVDRITFSHQVALRIPMGGTLLSGGEMLPPGPDTSCRGIRFDELKHTGKRMHLRSLAVLTLAIAASFGQASGPPTLQPDPPMQCDSCDGWNQPREPFKVFGNTYYVGMAGVSAVLIASDAGLILVDGALTQSAPLIDANIRTLGFKTENIKLIVSGHAHYDHAGGINALQRLSGAKVATGMKAVPALTNGTPTPDDPQVGFAGGGFPPIRNVQGVADGEVLRVGGLAITAHATPGHTPGGTSWSWRSCEGARCVDVVYADSLSAVAAPGYRFTGDATHPSIVESFRQSIIKFGELKCDIMIGAHPFVGDLDGKMKRRAAQPTGPNPFIDGGECRALAADAMKGLDARVAEESGKKLR